MAVGGCFCGNIRVEYTGQPIKAALCHCTDCRKLTGSIFTYNFAVKNTDLKITGRPKAVKKKADSGNLIHNYFCPDCGTPLYGMTVDSDGAPTADITVLRAGIFDDLGVPNEHKPDTELYVGQRVNWFTPLEGAEEFASMPPTPPS